MSRDKLVDVNDRYARQCKNVGCHGKSGPGKIHEVILVISNTTKIPELWNGLKFLYYRHTHFLLLPRPFSSKN